MEVKRYYMMKSAVTPMADGAPCYTPLVNSKTDLHIVPLVLGSDYDALRAENLGMVAQRMAYASEFPLGKDGLPDTGSIHQNIRKLKAEKDELVAALKRIDGMFIRGMVSDSWTTGAIAGEIAHEALAKHRGEAAESPANLTAS